MLKLLSLLIIWNLETGILDSRFSGQVTGSARTALAIVEDIRSRRPLIDLGADDFVVQEGVDGREVLSVRPADYPVVVMIDATISADDLPLVRKAAKRFLEKLGSERPVALGSFDGHARMLAGFDADRSALIAQLEDLASAPGADGSARQALELASATLAATAAPFSAIVILSAGPGDDRDATEGQDAAAAVSARGTILHVVARRSSGVTPSSRAAANRDEELHALAEQSRGQFITIYTAASFEAALGQLAARMTSELMIEYLVPNQSKATEVKLGVRVAGARVRGLGVR
jgi:hypothetical protein